MSGEPLVDVLARRGWVTDTPSPSTELPPSWKHKPVIVHAKGRVRVQCSCGEQLGPFERGEVESAWSRHRDGPPAE